MEPNRILQFDIDGQEVYCHELNGDRLWHCKYAYFQRMLVTYGEGFCPHVALAIDEAIVGGMIDVRSWKSQTHSPQRR